MEAIGKLVTSFSLMDHRLTMLMSAVADIKEKQSSFELSLLSIRPVPPSTQNQKQQRMCLPSTSPSPSPSTSTIKQPPHQKSVTVKQKSQSIPEPPITPTPTDPDNPWWYSDSFLDQISDDPEHADDLELPSETADDDAKTADDANDEDVLAVPLDSDVTVKLMYVSSSQRNFAANIMRKIFKKSEREVSNVRGKLGKSQLDPDKIGYIRSLTFKMYPLRSKEFEKAAWGACVNAIDEANRRLNRKKQ